VTEAEDHRTCVDNMPMSQNNPGAAARYVTIKNVPLNSETS
jgi:hypothetical protein